jgi:hypothetical protein
MITFLVIGVGLPLAAVIGNSIMRWAFRLPPASAAADLILVLVVFDIAILIQPAEVARFLPYAREFYGFVAFFSFILWAVAIGRLEVDLHAWAAARPVRGYPYRLSFYSLAMSGLALIATLAPLARSLS